MKMYQIHYKKLPFRRGCEARENVVQMEFIDSDDVLKNQFREVSLKYLKYEYEIYNLE